MKIKFASILYLLSAFALFISCNNKDLSNDTAITLLRESHSYPINKYQNVQLIYDEYFGLENDYFRENGINMALQRFKSGTFIKTYEASASGGAFYAEHTPSSVLRKYIVDSTDRNYKVLIGIQDISKIISIEYTNKEKTNAHVEYGISFIANEVFDFATMYKDCILQSKKVCNNEIQPNQKKVYFEDLNKYILITDTIVKIAEFELKDNSWVIIKEERNAHGTTEKFMGYKVVLFGYNEDHDWDIDKRIWIEGIQSEDIILKIGKELIDPNITANLIDQVNGPYGHYHYVLRRSSIVKLYGTGVGSNYYAKDLILKEIELTSDQISKLFDNEPYFE